ncbi:MAG: OmpH family outer membrane protein [Bacteroidetes bacterium]|nr:MAG: OmpH family outer membrane protein [Bacteroidota bacterium]
MRNLVVFILGLGLLSLTGTSYSQSQLKIGHVDIMKILSALPERDSAQVVLDKETKEIGTSFEEMQVIYNKLVDDYTKGQSTYSELVKKAKEDEILDKQKRLQEFEQNATATLQKRNSELIQPIYEKIIKTIEKVATENSFTYILDVSKGTVVFTSKDSQNIDQLVLALLK